MLVNAALPEQCDNETDCLHIVQGVGKVIAIHKVPNPESLFLELYDSHYEALKNKMLQYTASLRTNPEDADDIVQNVFKKLWENKNRLHEINSPESYLFLMAKHEFLDSKRHLIRKNKTLQYYELQQEREANTTEEMVLFKETEGRVEHAISELPPRMKETLKLKIEGYKITKIAGKMGITESTVKNQLQVVIKKMQACLEDEPVY